MNPDTTDEPRSHTIIGRRAFFRKGSLFLTTSIITNRIFAASPRASAVRFGLMTDLHYADKPSAGTRHYRETLGKLEEAKSHFQSNSIEFVVELGDLIDAAESVETELRYLSTIDREFREICDDRHYVLGNHCVDTLRKDEFLEQVGQAKSYYSFSQGGIHFVVLDACFRSDGVPYSRKNFQWTDANIPAEEREWLRTDLSNSRQPTIVFVHQRLDVNDSHGVRDNAEVRRILESSGQVLAVFQGHSHKNAYNEIGGIHYCTHVAMVEGSGKGNNAYSVIEVLQDGTIEVIGVRQQESYRWH